MSATQKELQNAREDAEYHRAEAEELRQRERARVDQEHRQHKEDMPAPFTDQPPVPWRSH